MGITRLISKAFIPRQHALEAYDTQAESLQKKQLSKLIEYARNTEWGMKYDYQTLPEEHGRFFVLSPIDPEIGQLIGVAVKESDAPIPEKKPKAQQ